MLNPAVPPILTAYPALTFAVILVVVPALAALAARYLLADPPAPSRHSVATVATPYRPRPWTETVIDVTPRAAEPIAYDPLDPRVPLAEVERRMALEAGAPVVAGLDTWDADTHELAALAAVA